MGQRRRNRIDNRNFLELLGNPVILFILILLLAIVLFLILF